MRYRFASLARRNDERTNPAGLSNVHMANKHGCGSGLVEQCNSSLCDHILIINGVAIRRGERAVVVTQWRWAQVLVSNAFSLESFYHRLYTVCTLKKAGLQHIIPLSVVTLLCVCSQNPMLVRKTVKFVVSSRATSIRPLHPRFAFQQWSILTLHQYPSRA